MITLERKHTGRSDESFEKRVNDIRQRREQADPKRLCQAPGCKQEVGKNVVGSFCKHHQKIQRKAGHAWHEKPRGKKRQAARKIVYKYLEGLSEQKAQTFTNFLSAAVRHLKEPVSNALPPSRARSDSATLTTKGKAQIVFAWLNKREDFERVALRLLVEAMSLEIWAACFYEDQKKRLPRLLRTTVGRTATRIANISQTKTRTVARWRKRSCHWNNEDPFERYELEETFTDKWNPTHTVKTEVGRRIFDALRDVLPASWVNDDIISETLREYETTTTKDKHQ